MNCIIKRPFEPVGRIRDIDNTLEALQKAGVALAKLRIKANKIRRGEE